MQDFLNSSGNMLYGMPSVLDSKALLDLGAKPSLYGELDRLVCLEAP